MARGINKVILIGNLGADPETRYTPQGSAITNLRIATDESYKDKNTGQMVPRTEWHRVVMFNRLAEIAKEYLRKGSKVYIEGRLQTQKWQGQDGSDRYTTEIIASEMQMLDSRQGGGFDNASQGGYDQSQSYNQPQGGYNQAPAPQQQNYQPQQNRAPQQAPQGQPPQQSYQPPAQQNGPSGFDTNLDDDIPF